MNVLLKEMHYITHHREGREEEVREIEVQS